MVTRIILKLRIKIKYKNKARTTMGTPNLAGFCVTFIASLGQPS